MLRPPWPPILCLCGRPQRRMLFRVVTEFCFSVLTLARGSLSRPASQPQAHASKRTCACVERRHSLLSDARAVSARACTTCQCIAPSPPPSRWPWLRRQPVRVCRESIAKHDHKAEAGKRLLPGPRTALAFSTLTLPFPQTARTLRQAPPFPPLPFLTYDDPTVTSAAPRPRAQSSGGGVVEWGDVMKAAHDDRLDLDTEKDGATALPGGALPPMAARGGAVAPRAPAPAAGVRPAPAGPARGASVAPVGP